MDPQQPLVGGPEPEPPGDQARMRVVVLVVAVGLTAGLFGFLFGATTGGVDDAAPIDAFAPVVAAPSTQGPEEATQGPEEASPTSAPSTTASTSTSLPVQPLLRDLVPGLTGTLVMVLGQWPGVDLVEWRSDRASPVTTALPPSVSLDPDVTGRLFAGLGPSANEEAQWALYVGPVQSMWPGAMNVTSLAWHNTIAGRLAWLRTVDQTTSELQTGDVDPSGAFTPDGIIRRVPADHRLLTWDSWGFLVTGWDPTLSSSVVYLVDTDGTEQWRLPAHAAYASFSNELLLIRFVEDSGKDELLFTFPALAAVEAPTLADWAPTDARGEINSVTWSPDTNHLAFLVWEGGATTWRIEVWRTDGTARASVIVPYRLWDVEWTRDGRFVLASGTDNAGKFVLLFYDTVDESLDEIEFDTAVLQVFTREGT